MALKKSRMIMKVFITQHFAYCLLVWMLYSRILNDKINSFYERVLSVTYVDKRSFQNLLRKYRKDNSASIHQRNLQLLVIKVFKVYNKMVSEILNDIFKTRVVSKELRNPNCFERRPVYSIFNGSETLSELGPKIWDLVPNKI